MKPSSIQLLPWSPLRQACFFRCTHSLPCTIRANLSTAVIHSRHVGNTIKGRVAPLQQHRAIHISQRKASTAVGLHGDILRPSDVEARRVPLSVLPLGLVLRSLLTASVASSPLLLPSFLRIMTLLAQNTNPLLNPAKNPVLRVALKRLFYAQFCAGENPAEVQNTIKRLKTIGFTGVILGYAREVMLTGKQAEEVEMADGHESQKVFDNEIVPWTEGVLETIRLAQSGDFVALKLTGAGSLALHQLKRRLPPSPYLTKSIDSICQLAYERGVRLLIDAEQDMFQNGIDDWTMQFASKYNKSPNYATIYGTYQAYKKITPVLLARHLAQAQDGKFTLGIKLVRGAYLESDPRECFHNTKEDTDACYDSIASSILTRRWNVTLQGKGDFPAAHLVLATHNATSVKKARDICNTGGAKSDIAFAQLQGMADEISCELLLEAGQTARADITPMAPGLSTYKYLVWGTIGECMNYLLRRAHENRDAATRTRSSRDAMWAEVVRRFKRVFRLA